METQKLNSHRQSRAWTDTLVRPKQQKRGTWDLGHGPDAFFAGNSLPHQLVKKLPSFWEFRMFIYSFLSVRRLMWFPFANKSNWVHSSVQYIYFSSLHVSGIHVPIIRRKLLYPCVTGNCHTVWVASGLLVGLNGCPKHAEEKNK